MAESPPVSNLFTKLHTWKGKKPRENFVTDSLVYVLQYLLQHKPKEGRRLFGALTGHPTWLPKSRCKKVTVRSQPSTKRGRPDIEIFCKGHFCIYVEVKVEAQLGKDQLKRYLKALEEKKKHEEKNLETQLVLLTKRGGENKERVHSVTWDKIITSLKGLKKKFPKSSISAYLTTQLHDFFEQQEFYEGGVKSKCTGKRFNVWLVSMRRKSPTDPDSDS